MKSIKEGEILAAVRNAEPKKKRVNFFITTQAKGALAAWCREHDISESSAIEQMIRAAVPPKFFRA